MDFQTPPEVCKFMADLAGSYVMFNDKLRILEPTKGTGNLVYALKNNYNFQSSNIITPDNFWDVQDTEKFDIVVMNPPFSPMELGYKILYRCMNMSDIIIALMPWLTIINSEKRTNDIINFGLRSVTHLPRKVFKGSRVQCCILEMKKGWYNETLFQFPNF
jgi:hypothetical protein